jgi:hypothetical protein
MRDGSDADRNDDPRRSQDEGNAHRLEGMVAEPPE